MKLAPQQFYQSDDTNSVALPKHLPTWRPADVVWQKPGLRAGWRALIAYHQPYLIIAGCASVTGFALTLLALLTT